jgi:hypothetical protein
MMADHDPPTTTENDDLFSQGWLDRHIDAVVAKNADAPEPLRSMVNGPYYHHDGTVRSIRRRIADD